MCRLPFREVESASADGYVVSQYVFRNLSSDKDYEDTVEFFKAGFLHTWIPVTDDRTRQDKDTEKFKVKLDLALEGIQVQSAWVKRSTEDIQSWFATHEK